ncbi:MAG TPA: MurR/RpiR family transcriptional regulator [Lachnospiraceae bacterium]|nr:MurR/RpiR family transcriptional regulator [Lachnospiraceae bacterium]
MDILTVLKEKYPSMTKKQKQLADFMLGHPEQMTFITLKELRNMVGVSEVTILRACADFGYDNFNEVKYEFRKYASMQEKLELHQDNEYISTYIPKYELQERERLLEAICKEEGDLMQRLIQGLDLKKIVRAARIIQEKKRIFICGRGISELIARAFSIFVSISGVACIAVNTELNDDVHSILPMLDKDAALLAVSFPDYYFMTTKMAEFAKKNGACVIGVTNLENAPVAEFCDEVLICPTTTRLFMNTMSAPMALMNILASAIEIEVSAAETQTSAEERFSELFRQ